MNRISIILSVAVLIFVTVGGVNATLVDQENGTLYDNVEGTYWYKDLSAFSNKTYAEQLDIIDAIPGTNFHLASYDEMNTLYTEYTDQEIGEAFTKSGERCSSFGCGIGRYDVWAGRYESAIEIEEEMYHYFLYIEHRTYPVEPGPWTGGLLEDSTMPDDASGIWYGAWVTSDTALVPIPATLVLLGSGLIGIVGIRKKFKK